MKNLVYFMFFSFFLSGCEHIYFADKPIAPKVITKTSKYASDDFSSIIAEGNMHLTLRHSIYAYSVKVHGRTSDTSHLIRTVNNHRLYLHFDEENYIPKAPISITVTSPALTSVTFDGEGHILARDLRSNNLDLNINTNGNVDIKGRLGINTLAVNGTGNVSLKHITGHDLSITMNGNPNVNLRGMANLSVLKFTGNGHLNFYWVNSPRLTIKGTGSAYVQLAGIVGTLHMALHGQTQMNGQYLRIKEAFIKTYDQVLAKVQVVNIQHALANDESNIYYYNTPTFQRNAMAMNGAVLDMQDNW